MAALALARTMGATVYGTSRDPETCRRAVELGAADAFAVRCRLARAVRGGARERRPGHLGPLHQGAAAWRTPGGLRRNVRAGRRGEPAAAVLQAARDHRLHHGWLRRVRPGHRTGRPGATRRCRRRAAASTSTRRRSSGWSAATRSARSSCVTSRRLRLRRPSRGPAADVACLHGRPQRSEGSHRRSWWPSTPLPCWTHRTDPRPSRAGLRGAPRPRPADRGARGRRARRSRRGAYDLPTAFEARAGSDGPTIAVLLRVRRPARASATPAATTSSRTAGLGAGLAAAAARRRAGRHAWSVLGTPAEEGGGGKVFMAERGAFDGVDAAMMVHPAGARPGPVRTPSPSSSSRSTYHGRAAHAAAAPQAGRNALDAAVLGYINVAALRQHIRPDERIHGIFTEAGEQAQHRARPRRGPLVRPVADRARPAAAQGPGPDLPGGGARPPPAARWSTSGSTRPTPTWSTTTPMVELYRGERSARTGRTLIDPVSLDAIVGSTDMGNVSHVVPVDPPDDRRVAARRCAIHTAGLRRATPAAPRAIGP